MVGKSIESHGQQKFILFPGSLGDFLCLLPAVHFLQGNPIRQNLTIVAREEAREVASWVPGVRKTISLDQSIFASLFSQEQSPSSELFCLFSSAEEIFSWFGHSSHSVRSVLEKVAPQRVRSFAFFSGQEDCHACLYYSRCIGGAELQAPSLHLQDEERSWVNSYWQKNGFLTSERLMVVHPGSGGKRKRWDTKGFIEVARWWKEIRKGKLIILIGPAEEEGIDWQALGTLARSLPLRHVAALLSRADFYVGNDSGISHLAGAVGTRGIVIFGPTRPQQWRPLGGALIVLQNARYREIYPETPSISLAEIPVEAVLSALMHIGA